MRQPTVIALRRPNRPWGMGPLGDLDIDPDPPRPPPDTEIPFEITLHPPNGLDPIVITRPKRSEIDAWPSPAARMDPAYLERAKGLWRISVKNINPTGYRMEVMVIAVHAITTLGRQDIPLALLNTVSSVALKKAMPTIEYAEDRIIISTPEPFLDLMDVDREYSLGSIPSRIIKDLPTFTPITVQMMSRDAFVARLIQRRAALDDSDAIDAIDGAVRQITGLPRSRTAYCLVLEGMFTDRDIELHYVGDIAEIDNQLPQIGLIFDEGLNFTDVVSTMSISLSPALTKIGVGTIVAGALLAVVGSPFLGVLAVVGGAYLYHSIADLDLEEEIRKQIGEMKVEIGGYVRRAIERMTDLGAMALEAKIVPGGPAANNQEVLRVHFFNPSTARPPRPWRPRDEILDQLPRIAEVLEIGAGETDGRPGGALVTEVTEVGRTRRRSTASRRTSAARVGGAVVPEGVVVDRVIELMREPTGPPPDDWVTPAPETLARLDAHDCIVVVMMENRSYDHYFHDLPTVYPGRGYRSVPASYANDPPPGFDQPFRPVKNTTIGIGKNLIFIGNERSLDPNHNIDHTALQMSRGVKLPEGTRPTGEMAGFAIDFAGETDSPQIVMSYFGMDDLPVFGALAGQYPVCDRWFAALPVGTYPNRLSMLQGNVPFLRNIKMDDPSLGYLEDYSIFDVLDRQGISWQMYESDIGTVRLYDRYRLNVANVRPIQELEVMLAGVEHGLLSLPRVLFIEPAFLYGDDDHPPMGIHQGQSFLRQVLGKFLEHGQLGRTLFVITYDEHGGFFDHVSPPGTRRNRRPPGTEVAGRYVGFEGLFPQGRAPRPDRPFEDDLEPTSLGVRVPSLVLSPWASAKANHTILDHTAILKTILLHNRNSISTAQYGRFGERVKKRAHLGQVLDLDAPTAPSTTGRSSERSATSASRGNPPATRTPSCRHGWRA